MWALCEAAKGRCRAGSDYVGLGLGGGEGYGREGARNLKSRSVPEDSFWKGELI